MLSMTGFGRAEAEENGNRVWMEVKSVNNRFCTVIVRLPKLLASLEQKVTELVQRSIARGRVEVTVNWESQRESALSVDIPRAKAYRDNLLGLKKALRLAGKVDVTLLATLPGVITDKTDEIALDSAGELVQKTCQAALDEHRKMREAEGERLCQDMTERIRLVDGIVGEIEKLVPAQVEQQRERLTAKLENMLPSGKIDEQRLAMEVALIAERTDISEECTRLHSHNAQFLKTASEENPVGRKLDFILQEINREANTMGAKANNASLSHLVINIKEEVERIREQVQNVE